jgi:hypothetical protein
VSLHLDLEGIGIMLGILEKAKYIHDDKSDDEEYDEEYHHSQRTY